MYLTGLWYVLNGCFSCTAWVLCMYWTDISHETTPCLICWIPDITDWPTLQLKPFNLRLNLQYEILFIWLLILYVGVYTKRAMKIIVEWVWRVHTRSKFSLPFRCWVVVGRSSCQFVSLPCADCTIRVFCVLSDG